MLRLWVQKVRFSNPNSLQSEGQLCRTLWPPLRREGGVKEETLRSASRAAVPSRAPSSQARGKGLQAEMALPQSPLPATQFECMISVDVNTLEGL